MENNIANSRREAIQLGFNKYYGNPCQMDHIGIRRVKGNQCIECAKNNLQIWRNENSDYVRERDSKYQLLTKDRRNALERERYRKNPEKFRSKTRKQYNANPEPRKEYSKAKYKELSQDKEFREQNAIRVKYWTEQNQEKAKLCRKVQKHKRRARELNLEGFHTRQEIQDIYELQNGKCVYCKSDLNNEFHLDHIIPIVLNGTNYKENLQCLCPSCNLRKASKHPIAFAKELGLMTDIQ